MSAAQLCDPIAEYPSGLPASTELRLTSYFTTPNEPGSCASGCSLGAWTTEAADPTTVVEAAFVPITIAPPPVEATPAMGLPPSGTTMLTASGVRPGAAQVAQSAVPVQHLEGANCSTPVDVAVGTDWTVSADVPVSATFTTADGPTATCVEKCHVVLLTDTGRVIGSQRVTFGGPAIVPLVSGPYPPGPPTSTSRWSTSRGAASRSVNAWRRSGPISRPATATPLRWPRPVSTTGSASSATSSRSSSPPPSPPAGRWSTARGGGSCVIAAFGDGYETVTSLPIAFRPPAAVTVTPSRGLVDGDPITAHATDLVPGDTYRVDRSASVSGSARCARVADRIADPNGEIVFDTTAVQRFTSNGLYRYQYCRENCSIVVRPYTTGNPVEASYAMAEPSVSASPANALVDGGTVTVDGTGLQPTYAGPTVLFSTGGWAVAVCDRSVVDDPNLYAVLTKSAVPAGGTSVTVTGSTVSVDVQVPATITHTLGGGTTDCTAASGACVVGLTRWEQDATVSAAFTPVSFG